MIPKVIHYCWFGRNPKPESVLKYIQTWKDKMPDYEIKEWNEDNFDVNYNSFTREAYFAKKYAFVSDVARLFALVNEGGIYFDTDVLMLKPFTAKLLNEKAFIGFERKDLVSTAMLACERGNATFKDFLLTYKDDNFFKMFRFNTNPNTCRLTAFLNERGLILNDKFQYVDDIAIYPSTYFCAKNWFTGKTFETQDTFLIHDYEGSWVSLTHGKFSRIISEAFTIIQYKLNKNVEF